MKIITIEDFKTKRGLSCSHIISLDNGKIIHCFGYEDLDEKLEDKTNNYYKVEHGFEYKIYKNIFK